MTQNIQSAIPAIAAVVAGAISKASAIPLENASDFPLAMTYLFDGEVQNPSFAETLGLHNVAIDLLIPHNDVHYDLAILYPLMDAIFIDLIAEKSSTTASGFGGTVDTFDIIRPSFIANYPYSGQLLYGYRLLIEQVKLVGTVE